MNYGVKPGMHPRFTVVSEDPTRQQTRSQREAHDRLVEYLLERFRQASNDRNTRLRRYATLDRALSTWQKLSIEDTERQVYEDATGRTQGYPINLPILATHLEDMVAYFSELFAPLSGNFYQIPEGIPQDDTQATELVKIMNREAGYDGYHAQIAKTLRTLIKYNIGGIELVWEEPTDMSEGGNRHVALDMYNTFWDPAVPNVNDVSRKAEWIAKTEVVTRRQLHTGAMNGDYSMARVKHIFHESGPSDDMQEGSQAFYVRPPNHAGLTRDGADATSLTSNEITDWASYGLGDSESSAVFGGIQYGQHTPAGAYEMTTVYIWLDPTQFGLLDEDGGINAEPAEYDDSAPDDDAVNEYSLWRIRLIDGKTIISSELMVAAQEAENDEQIPIILSHYTDDELGEAQRSPMELLRGFQRFASFLMNIWILGARKNVYGTTYVDEDMFDIASIIEGQVAGIVKSKSRGRDIRSGIYKDTGNASVDNAIQMLTHVLDLTKTLFPSQALPSQIAGIDRAVKNQVSAVLQGGQARLKLQARILDSSLFMRCRRQAVRFHIRNSTAGIAGIKEEHASAVLGSGLLAMNAERVETLLKEIIAMVASNEQLSQTYDLAGMFTAMSTAMNLGVDLGAFVRKLEQSVAQEGANRPDSSGQEVALAQVGNQQVG